MSVSSHELSHNAAAWTRASNVISGLVLGLLRRLASWQVRREATEHLRTWSDAELKDIGLTRCEIEFAVRSDRREVYRMHEEWQTH